MFNAVENNNYPQKFLENLSNENSSVNNANNKTEPSGFAVIPYVKGTSEPIKRILGKYNVKTALKPYKTLGQIFPKPKDKLEKEQMKGAIYSIPCRDCEQVYIGQTKRQFGTRLKEHKSALSAKRITNSALADHSFKTSHKIEWNNASIISCNPHYHQRICLEAWHINSMDYAINRDDGNLFPEAYKHFIKKHENAGGAINTGMTPDDSNP